MAKKSLAFFMAFLLALIPFTGFSSGGAVAVLQSEVVESFDPDIDPDLDADVEALEVSAQYTATLPAKSAILIEQHTGKVLFEQNADEQIPPASVTKIMTLLLVMEALEAGKIKLEDQVVTSEYANSMGGSQIWLKVGEEMSVDNLIKAVAIASANDASAALGEYVAGGNDAFIAMMNERAKQLGMNNTNFVNATGLDDANHLTTARDIAIMSRELIKHPLISEYSTIWMDSLRGGATELVNTNKLVRFYKGATGLKTGTTNGAGSCLSATATRDGLSLIAVVMGCPTSNDRFASAKGLLDFGFVNYESVIPPAIDDQLTPVPVLRGVEDSVMPTYKTPGSLVVEKGTKDLITQTVTLSEDIEAPIEEGQIVGKVNVLLNGEKLGEYDLIATTGVMRMTFSKAFQKLVVSALKMRREISPAEKNDKPRQEASAPDETSEMPQPEPTEPCSCGLDKCYCKEIGDICGCTKE